MTRSTRSKWLNTVGLLAAAVVLAWSAVDGDSVVGWLLAAACLAGAAWASPLGDRKTLTHAEATELPSDDRVVVYARPGCSWCMRLRIVLQLRGAHVQWVDVWADPEASAFVKSVNDGDEVVPTVVVDGRPRTNPPPSWVVNAAHAA